MGRGRVEGGGLRIGTAQVWGLRLRSSPGWLAPLCRGLLETDRQRVVSSPVTLDIGETQDSGLVLCLASTLRAFALGDPICSQGCNYTQRQKRLWFIRELRLDLPDSPVISMPHTGPKPVPPPTPPPHTHHLDPLLLLTLSVHWDPGPVPLLPDSVFHPPLYPHTPSWLRVSPQPPLHPPLHPPPLQLPSSVLPPPRADPPLPCSQPSLGP